MPVKDVLIGIKTKAEMRDSVAADVSYKTSGCRCSFYRIAAVESKVHLQVLKYSFEVLPFYATLYCTFM